MALTLRSNHEVSVAFVSGVLDDAEGQQFAAEITRRVPEGGKLVVDGSQLTRITQKGVAHLIAVQSWTRTQERRRLRIIGFAPAVWQEIVRQQGEWLFDVQKTLADALASLGVKSDPAAAMPSGSHPPAITLPQHTEIVSAPAPAAYSAPPSPPRSGSPGGRKSWLRLALAGLVIMALAGWGWWRWQAHRLPTLTLSAPSIRVEEDGKEVDEVKVEVQRGKLEEKSWEKLPQGLYFEPASDRHSNKAYLLRGRAERGAKSATVDLDAVGENGQHAAPVVFRVEVSEKPMTWQLNTLQSLSLRVNSPILAESKFVSGAATVSTAGEMPPGLRLELTPGTARDWQLAGTPTQSGVFPLVFKAASSSGEPQEKSCRLEIEPDVPAAPPPAAVAGETATPPSDLATRPTAAADDGMRRFLLERIEKLPARYTEEDRENLCLVVNSLKQSRLVHRVAFEHVGQTEISADQVARLRAILQSPDLLILLKNPDCQIAIVGYASKGGSLLSNVRISKARARAVDDLCKSVLGRNADLCGDYGPTDVVDQFTEEANRAVEIYAGLLDLPVNMRAKAAGFRDDFNSRHGAH